MKILVVEDEPKTGNYLKQGLLEAGFGVDLARDGDDGLHYALTDAYDLVVLDVMLPGIDGWAVLQGIRKSGKDMPVLFLTARDQVDDRVRGLESGADDYLVKPFDFDELLARLEALSRRGAGSAPTSQVGSVVLDTKKRSLVRASQEVTLTAREFALANELWSHGGDVLSRSRLLSSVWGTDFDGLPNVVDVYVGYLRTKLSELGATDVEISAVRGIGYRLKKVTP